MQLQPYLFFDGRAEEAAHFYRDTLGAEIISLFRLRDNPEPAQSGMVPPNSGDKVMHMTLRIAGTTVLASDGECLSKPSFEGFALSLNVDDDDEAKRVFAALSEGGQVQMPLTKTFFASSFGNVKDKFGVTWMVATLTKQPG